MRYITFLFLFISLQSNAQSSSLSKAMAKIDYQKDTVHAVFQWVTDNIKYDVSKLKQLESGVNFYEKGGYKSEKEYNAALLQKVITKKKGVCDDYTILMDAILKELGYTSQIIRGVTKNEKGKMSNSIGHSWIAAHVDGAWKLYDPTWAAGYTDNNRKFVKSYNDKWYDVDPETLKKTHLPFDPIWQLKDAPISFIDFRTGKQTDTVANINHEGLIQEYIGKEIGERNQLELARLKVVGGNTKPFKNRMKYLQSKLNGTKARDVYQVFNKNSEVFSDYYSKGKNKRFTGKKWTKAYSISALQEIQMTTKDAVAQIKSVKATDKQNRKGKSKAIRTAKKMLKMVDKELRFLQE